MTFFLPLGLSGADPFWSLPCQEWTSVKAFGGEDILADHGYNDAENKFVVMQYQWEMSLSKKWKILLIGSIIVLGVLSLLGIIKLYDLVRKVKI